MNDSSDRDVEVFTEALQLPASQRAAYLDRACGGDVQLRLRVEALLKGQDEVGDFLEHSPHETTAQGKPGPPIGEKAGDRVGRYKLLQQIGEGGCGVVFMAEQEQPVRRRVALKIIKPGMDTKSVIARFEAERQALALMDHPNIAKMFDAGATDSGRPYFVMELVRGIKITEYCDQRSLTTQERLELFTQVCEAVQHAHQKGIIHRDIKPANILVTTTAQGTALPVVIDFGIAKATSNQPLTDKTVFTAFEMLIGTPAYMSPEQADFASVDLDTRTDIYSLGVLLYELLTGSTPFDTTELLKCGLDEIRRVIREREPVSPSARLSKLTQADLTTVARFRHSEQSTLVRMIRGDLDWIVMKALEKDRTRRYATANGLALDVKRFLANETISARPPSKVYRFRKTVSRNKLLFTAIGVITLLLVVGLIVVSTSLAKEREALVTSRQIENVMKDMLNRAGPISARGRDTTMFREILDQTAEHLGKDMPIQPAIEADMRDLIGKLYEQVKDLKKAEELEREALAIRERVFGPNSLQSATSLNDLGLEFMAEHKLPEAEKAHSEALDIRKRLLGMENAQTATSLNDLAAVYRDEGRIAEAHSLASEALRIRREVLGPEHVDVADSLRNLCIIAGSEGKWDRAEELAREALEMRRKVLPADHPYIADSLEDLAWAESGESKFKEAKATEAQALALRGTLLDPSNPDIARSINALGQLLAHQGDLPTSDAILRAVLSIQRKVVGEDNQATIDTFVALSRVLNSENKTNESESMLREALAALNKKGDDASPQKLLIMRGICDTLEQEGRWQEAEPLWREALPLWRKRRGGEDNESMYTLRRLGLTLEAEHKWPEAEALYREALSISRKKGEQDPEALMDLEKLSRVLMYEKRFSDAQDLLDKVLTPSSILQPSSAGLLVERVSLNGRRGRWREAKADAALALKSLPTDHYQYHMMVALLAITDDRPAYDELCHTLVAKFPNPTNPYIAERIAQDCLLLPNSGVSLEVIDKLADTSVTLGSGESSLPYFQACKAMSNYRLGRFGDAITWGEKAARNDTAEPQAKAKALAVLAMAYWQLGQKDVARARLDTGNALAPVFTPGPDADLGASWIAWIMARISLDEATKLIRTGATTETPNTHP